ncbi:MAG: helix-turn-helix transcriptional regulator, partial [bacterium]
YFQPNFGYFYKKYESLEGKIRINRIKSVLVEKDIAQKELAKKVKRTPNTITRICNNDSQPTLKLLREIAIALNVDIRELLLPTTD